MKYKCIFYIFTSENIKLYIFTPPECTYNFLGLPLTFPLFVNENIKCGYAFSKLEREEYFATKIILLC